MIEKIILDHLKTKLSVPVYLEKPETAPAEYVLFEKTGSGENSKLPNSTFAFKSHSTSLYKAAELNEKLKTAVESLIILNDVSKVKLNSDYNFTDTVTKKYRYQAVYDIYHY